MSLSVDRGALLHALDSHAQAFAIESAGRFETGGVIAKADVQVLMRLAEAIVASVALWRTIAGRLDVATDETFDAADAASMVLESVFDHAYRPLVDLLEKHAKREKRVAELTGQKFEAQLMIVADQTTPYRLLTEIIYSCGQAGYANYRLLVLKAKGD